MNSTEIIVTILLVALATALTRFLPFILFSGRDKPPKYLAYLGRVLPPAVFAMLVVYCLKGVTLVSSPYGIPELVSVAAVVIIHLLFRKTLLSVIGGTGLYLILVNLVFI